MFHPSEEGIDLAQPDTKNAGSRHTVLFDGDELPKVAKLKTNDAEIEQADCCRNEKGPFTPHRRLQGYCG